MKEGCAALRAMTAREGPSGLQAHKQALQYLEQVLSSLQPSGQLGL